MGAFLGVNLMPFTAFQSGVLAVTTSSGRVAVGTTGDTLLVMNDGTVTAYFEIGDSTVVATAGGVLTAADTGSPPILAGAILTVLIPPNATHVAGICDSGTPKLRLVRGKGQ